jgi:nucleoside-diphosphate-sugar epimerase
LKKPIQVFGPLESYRDYISIESLLKALIRVTSLNSSEVINIGSGEKTSLGDLLDIFIKSFKDFFEIQYLPARSSDRLSYSLDVNKSIKLLGQYHIPPVIDLLNEFISNELGKFNLKNPG